MSTNFKLSKRGGVTRRISFSTLPSWNELAEKISALYSIPLDKVAVSYVDAEDDEVTLSTNEELQDYYQASRKPGEVVKFAVQDLSANRLEDKSLPETPLSTGNIRNTFGREGGLPFDIDHDWQNVHSIPIPGLFAVPSDGPHAFVEVVPTDASSISSRDSDTHSTAASDFLVPRTDKGKGKAVDLGSSTASLLNEKVPSKHDLHVFGKASDSAPPSPASSSVPTVSAPLESTPKVSTKKLDDETADTAGAAADVADPPLPTFETANPTLAHDIAALLTTLSSVVSSHPELSEGLRNIVRNAANGTYWQAHREALRNAADELSQSAGLTATAVEEEAGRRVAEALGNIFRAVANTVGPFTSEPPSEQDTGAEANGPSGYGGQRGWRGRGPRFGEFWPGPPPPQFGPPPFGPPPFGPPTFGPGRRGSHHDGWSSFWGGTPAPPPPAAPQPPAPAAEPKSRASPQELRAQVEAAKLLYKAEKERYRQEREERKKERDRRLRLIADAAAAEAHQVHQPKTSGSIPAPPPTQLVSNARGPYPQLEMFNVPRRHSTLPSSFGRSYGHRAEAVNESPSARAQARINKKLADMGFTESAHPELPSKIKAQLPENGATISKENEDDIVTNLLEELIVLSPKVPHASGSGLQDKDDIPGAWH